MQSSAELIDNRSWNPAIWGYMRVLCWNFHSLCTVSWSSFFRQSERGDWRFSGASSAVAPTGSVTGIPAWSAAQCQNKLGNDITHNDSAARLTSP